jgi:hypothetical protein
MANLLNASGGNMARVKTNKKSHPEPTTTADPVATAEKPEGCDVPPTSINNEESVQHSNLCEMIYKANKESKCTNFHKAAGLVGCLILGMMLLPLAFLAPKTCPLKNDDVLCRAIYDPVICKGSCGYENLCSAEGAGFSEKACRTCPTMSFDDDTNCSWFRHELVLCNDVCYYENFCFAKAAGFSKRKCRRVSY